MIRNGAFRNWITTAIRSRISIKCWPQGIGFSGPSRSAFASVSTRPFSVSNSHLQKSITPSDIPQHKPSPIPNPPRNHSALRPLWTLEEDNILFKLVKEGKSAHEIRKSLPKRSDCAIRGRMSIMRTTVTLPLMPDGSIESMSTISSAMQKARRKRADAINRILGGQISLASVKQSSGVNLLQLKEIEEEVEKQNAEKFLRGRSPRAVRRAWRGWTSEEDDLLRQLVAKHFADDDVWHKVSVGQVKGPDGGILTLKRSLASCKDRWKQMHRPEHLKRGPWSKEERDRLLAVVQEQIGVEYKPIVATNTKGAHAVDASMPRDLRPGLILGGPLFSRLDWHAIAAQVGTRDVKQCRSAFYAFHNGSRGTWTDDEKRRLYEGYEKCGNQWVAISAHVGSRSPGQCKAMYKRQAERELFRNTASK